MIAGFQNAGGIMIFIVVNGGKTDKQHLLNIIAHLVEWIRKNNEQVKPIRVMIGPGWYEEGSAWIWQEHT